MPDQDYLLAIITPLASRPEAIKISRQADDLGVLLSLTLAQEDMGRVIGKEGMTAKAIRAVLNAFGFKEGKKLSLKIIEQTNG